MSFPVRDTAATTSSPFPSIRRCPRDNCKSLVDASPILGYFAALQIPIVRGRTFTDQEWLDRADKVIISQLTADSFFPNEDPIGKHLVVDVGWGQQSASRTKSSASWATRDTSFRCRLNRRCISRWAAVSTNVL